MQITAARAGKLIQDKMDSLGEKRNQTKVYKLGLICGVEKTDSLTQVKS